MRILATITLDVTSSSINQALDKNIKNAQILLSLRFFL
ncbi:hypothetical protein [Prevotella sp. MA2016]